MKFHKSALIKSIGALTALLGSFGLVFGLAAFDHTDLFIDFNHPKATISYYDETPQNTQWNVPTDPTPFFTPGDSISFASQTDKQAKFNYAALVIDGATHQVLDKSFNQSGYQGLVDWIWTDDWYNRPDHVDAHEPISSYNPNKLGTANGSKPSTDNANDFWIAYGNLIESGYKSLVLPGYMHQTGLANFKGKSKDIYQKAGYILLDANTPDDKNIASVVFRSDEVAFMSAIATCQYLNDNFDEYKSGGLRIGMFGGVAIPSVTIYMGGFEYGVQVWNNYINEIAAANHWTNPEQHKVNIINLGAKDSWFSNSFSIGDGAPLVKALLQRGADAILPVAGPQTIDTVRQIKAASADCIVVGVDTAQEDDQTINDISTYTDVSGNNKIIKFSATKNIAYITSKILSLAMAHWPNDLNQSPNLDQVSSDSMPKIGSFGYLTVCDVQNDGIRPSDAALPYLLSFIRDVTNKLPVPGEDTYSFICHQFTAFSPSGSSTSINYFDKDHISSKDLMQLRI